MKRALNNTRMIKWAETVGGIREATIMVMNALKCSPSKAEKIASGRYPSLPQPLEQEALLSLLNVSKDELFPLVAAKGKRRAS